MFEQLLEIVRQQADEQIVRNDAIDNKFNEDAIQEAANSIQDTLRDQLANGHLQDVMQLFRQGDAGADNPMVQQISSMFSKQLGSKFQVDGLKADGIASQLIPMILSRFIKKTNDPDDASVDINDIFGSLTGNKSSGIDFSKILKQEKDDDGFGMDDIMDMVKKGASSQKGGGGLLGSLLGGK
ncbi:MAG TPA: hypothetical protein PKX04_10575 [Chitinophagales bacterium]|nr:hypothetical protein [Chitinophagales bacterium]HPR28452.1 hypothetical protein [Chitinophagales bacterium]